MTPRRVGFSMSASESNRTAPPLRWRTATVALIVVVVLLGGGLAYVTANYSSLSSKYNQLNTEYQNEVQRYSALQTTLTQRLTALNGTANHYGVLADAYAHWDAIAARNLTATVSDYAPSIVLHWVGGALNGTYTGPANVSKVWSRFFAGSSALWWSTIGPVTISMSSGIATVNATLQFTLTPTANPLDLPYLDLAYSLGFTYASSSWWIANEVWALTGHGDLTSQSAYVLSVAYSHWDAIAIENTSLLAPQYASTAVLHWVGGPLSGTYSGTSPILNTWNRFFGIWSAVWFYAESPPVVSVVGGTAQVNALLQFPLTPFANPTDVQALTINYTLALVATPTGWIIQQETWDIVGTTSFVNESAYLTALAFAHWDAITTENLSEVLGQYNATSSLAWAGGAGVTNGTYNGTSAIGTAWSSFFAAWNGGLWLSTNGVPTVTLSPTGGTVQTVLVVVANATSAGGNSTSELIIGTSVTYTVSSATGNWTITLEAFHVLREHAF